MFEGDIKKVVMKAFDGREIRVEVPPDPDLGDFAVPFFEFAVQLKKAPVKIAEEIASKIKKPSFIEKIKSVNGYINFFLKTNILAETVLSRIIKEKEMFGSNDKGKAKTVVVEFSSPNIGKPFSIGHLRSTVIGNSIHLIHKFCGYRVVKINHLGDWGTQFGALICAYLKWGDRNKLNRKGVQCLFELYVKFHDEVERIKSVSRRGNGKSVSSEPALQKAAREWFKKLEEGNNEAVKLWSKFRITSLKEFKRVYKLLSVDFDSYAGESFFYDKVDVAIKAVEKKKLTKMSEGALIVDLKKYGMPPAILIKTDEATTYLSRDLAAFLYRLETYKPEKIFYVVGAEQQLHFNQLFKVAELMNCKAAGVHIIFGHYRFETGRMRTRKGEIVLMEDVLKESIQRVKKIIREKNPKLKNKTKIAKIVGVGAVIFGDLVNDRIKDIIFSWERILDFEGDTGPYVQYTFARANSILKTAKKRKISFIKKIDFSSLMSGWEKRLLILLSQFPECVSESLKHCKTHLIAQYLLKLCRAFNEFYHKIPCVQEKDRQARNARLWLVSCTKQVINNCLFLLGIQSPEEM